MPVTVICNVSQRQVVVNRLELGGGWGSAPDWRQAGSRALEQQRLGCQRGSGRRSVNHQVTLYWQSGPRWRGPVSLLMLGPAGAPCAPAVPWAHPWACAQHHGAPRRAHVAAEARSLKVPRFAGRAQRNPQTTPLNACWRLAALPARATSGGGLSACAWGCRWHSLRNNARASRADGAAAMPPLHYRAAGALSRPRAHKPCRAARPLPLAAYRWPHLGGARPPGPVTGLGRLARPGLYNGPYSGARALSGPRAHSRAPGGGHCSQRWARYRGLIIWGRCPQPPGAAAPQARAPPYLDTLVTTHADLYVCITAKNGITKAPMACCQVWGLV